MREKGFHYTPIEYPDEGVYDRLHSLDESQARTWGYHLPQVTFVNPNTEDLADPAFYAAAEGTNESPGCAATSRDATFGTVAWYTDAAAATISSFEGFIAGFFDSEGGQEVATSWSACMARSGYDFRTPLDPLEEYAATPAATSAEIQVRLADLACDQQVGLSAARSAYERERRDRWLEENQARIESLRDERPRFEDQLDALDLDG